MIKTEGTVEQIKKIEELTVNNVIAITREKTIYPVQSTEKPQAIDTKVYSINNRDEIRFHYNHRENKASMKLKDYLYKWLIFVIPELPGFLEEVREFDRKMAEERKKDKLSKL